MNEWYCYLLLCSNGYTYVGATIDLDRRLRQHNNEIKGGAKATTSKSKAGYIWKRICYVKGFPDQSSALQFEWKWKNLTKKSRSNPLQKRINALKELLLLDKPTKESLEFKNYPNGKPIVVWETLVN